MKSIVVQLIFILSLAAVIVPFVRHVQKVHDNHRKWARDLSDQAEKARLEGRAKEAEELRELSWNATCRGVGLPWYAKDWAILIILFLLVFLVFEAFSYIGLGRFLEVNEDIDYF